MMFVEEKIVPQLKRDLSPFQCQRLLQLVMIYGEERFARAAAKLQPNVADPVAFMSAALEGRRMIQARNRIRKNHGNRDNKTCRSCGFRWNQMELSIFACPRCQAGIVGRDGRIDPELYRRYMNGESIGQSLAGKMVAPHPPEGVAPTIVRDSFRASP